MVGLELHDRPTPSTVDLTDTPPLYPLIDLLSFSVVFDSCDGNVVSPAVAVFLPPVARCCNSLTHAVTGG